MTNDERKLGSASAYMLFLVAVAVASQSDWIGWAACILGAVAGYLGGFFSWFEWTRPAIIVKEESK